MGSFVISHPVLSHDMYALSNINGSQRGLLVERVELSHLVAGADWVTVNFCRNGAFTAPVGSPIAFSTLSLRDDVNNFRSDWAPSVPSPPPGFTEQLKYAGGGSPLVIPFSEPWEIRAGGVFLYFISGNSGAEYVVNLHCTEY